MIGKNKTLFQKIANDKGWTFENIGERWGVSERQMSRVANSGNQRDIDAVTGIPSKVDVDMIYEQITHDQVLFCATEITGIHNEIRQLTRKKDSKERRLSAKLLDHKLNFISAKFSMLGYMYRAANRLDLDELVAELLVTSLTEATTAMVDPDGWREQCSIVGMSSEPIINDIDDAVRDWRLKFLAAIKTK